MKAVCLAVLSLALVTLVATAAAAPSSLRPEAKKALVATVAHRPFLIDCTYADRNSDGFSQPAWHGQPSQVYVKPWACARANLLQKRHGHVRASELAPLAQALLLLAHEATHVSDFPGARDEALTECHALQAVSALARALGANDGLALSLGRAALPFHDRLLADYPGYDTPECRDGGALDEHPDSSDWPG